jgi:hypothetical protein
MMVEQMGNMLEKAQEGGLKMVDPTNYEDFTEEDREQMLKEI